MADALVFEEEITDALGTYTARWFCEVPAADTAYVVTEQQWNDDYTVRDIFKVLTVRETGEVYRG
jgi:hypothetical protein